MYFNILSLFYLSPSSSLLHFTVLLCLLDKTNHHHHKSQLITNLIISSQNLNQPINWKTHIKPNKYPNSNPSPPTYHCNPTKQQRTIHKPNRDPKQNSSLSTHHRNPKPERRRELVKKKKQ